MNHKRKKYFSLFFAAIAASVLAVGVAPQWSTAFTGPGQGGGTGSGAIGVDASNNLSLGTSIPLASTKLYIVAPNTSSANYSLRIVQPSLTPIFAVRNDGRVGIGTDTPGYTLEVNGNAYISGTLIAGALSGPYTGTINASNVTAGVFGAGNFSFPSSLGIATTTQVGLPQPLSVYGNAYVSANLAVGKITPAYAVDVNGTVNMTGFRMTTGAGAAKVLTSDASGNASWQTPSGGGGGSLPCWSTCTHGVVPYFFDGTGDGVGDYLDDTRLYSSGGLNIGIDQPLPTHKLHIAVSSSSDGILIEQTGVGSPYVKIHGNSGRGVFGVAGANGMFATGVNANDMVLAQTQGSAIKFATFTTGSTQTRMTILGNGNIGIGTTGPGNILSVVAGSATDPIADAWTVYSSRRWKENIQTLAGGLDAIVRLRGTRFDWKEGGKKDIGMIAEEVAEVVPEAVVLEEDGVSALSLDYGKLVPILVEAVKEQQMQIADLQRRVDALKRVGL